jgi:hypothetical protein
MEGVSPEDADSSSVSGLGSENRTRFLDLLGVAGGVTQARGSPSDCPVLSLLAVSLAAATTTQSGGVWLHRCCDFAVDVAVDV